MVSERIGLSWEDAFKRAAADFRDEYEQSGTRKNSLAALGDILLGYLKAFYGGLARPAAKSLVEYGAKGGAYGIFLPGAVVTVISGRTIEATGLTVVYASKMGYHVITPTVEAGFMTGLAVLSLAATPVTGVGGAGLAVVNQVAFTSVAPAYGVGRGVAETAIDSGKYVALVAYDVAERNSRVMINYLSTGVVLGYNALTAIPVHLILGAADAAVFLAWDGPRLVVAVASGQVTDEKGEGSFSLGQLPTGSVVDLEKLRKQEGITVDIVTDDPDVIDRIFEKMPEDMGENHEH